MDRLQVQERANSIVARSVWKKSLDDNIGTDASVINIGDMKALNPGVSASTARPPMMNFQPAFFTNGGTCPFSS